MIEFFEDDDGEIMEARANGRILQPFEDRFSRPSYYLPIKHKLHLVKFDNITDYREDAGEIIHQSSYELDMFYNHISESDRWAFLAPSGGKMVELGDYGRGYVIQPFVFDMIGRVPASHRKSLNEIVDRYGFTDIDPYSSLGNVGYIPSQKRAVIYDWGL